MAGKLRTLSLPCGAEAQLPKRVSEWVQFGEQSVRNYWDRHHELRNTEWVECDYREVASALVLLTARYPGARKSFLEWGSGFGVVAATASLLGFEAVGVEAEKLLLDEAKRIQSKFGVSCVEFWHGNFLPEGAEQLAEEDDPRVALKSNAKSSYEKYGRELTEFETIFAYPWPGEEHFLKSVFREFAAERARLLLYRGPFQVELYEKIPTENR